jgi:16S rRNA (guanine527-N7)-methyltransferase
MTEEEARDWVAQHHGNAAVDMLQRFATLVIEESNRQNLIAPSTIPAIWVRHLLDSAQLAAHAPTAARRWVDVGSGAGFPGLVVAALFDGEMLLVEPRTRRADFLETAVEALGLAHRATVFHGKAEAVTTRSADVVSARAVATIDALFSMSAVFSALSTTFILPRGRSGVAEVESVRGAWHGTFHVEQSLTDPASTIVIASGVTRACSASR